MAKRKSKLTSGVDSPDVSQDLKQSESEIMTTESSVSIGSSNKDDNGLVSFIVEYPKDYKGYRGFKEGVEYKDVEGNVQCFIRKGIAKLA